VYTPVPEAMTNTVQAPNAPHLAALTSWTLPTRLAFRFCFLYLLLFLVPRPFVNDPLPPLPLINTAVRRVWELLLWGVTTRGLGWQGVDVRFNFGGGDVLVDYVRAACCIILAAVGTVVWSFAGRSQLAHPRLHEGLRIYLRVVLAIAMMGYALGKLFGTQFGYSLMQLFRPVGQLEPMALLWMFMGYSPAYAWATGVVELVGGLLLVFRRTSTAGAILVLAAISNVVALNLTYDVQVKLYSIHLWLMAAFLLAPRVPLLATAVFKNAADGWSPGVSARTRRASTVATMVLIGVALVLLVQRFSENRRRGYPAELPPLVGVYEVTSFKLNGVPIPPLTTDTLRWRRMVVDPNGSVAVQMMNDSVRRYRSQIKESSNVMELSGAGTVMQFRYSKPTGETTVLAGGSGTQAMELELQQLPEQSLPLLARRFRWTR